MKKTCSLFWFSFFALHSAFGQGGSWTWVSGSNMQGAIGVSGTKGIPSVNNYPTAKYGPCEWKDKQGNFWIYGGTAEYGYANCDLWKYNPASNEWTWVHGDLAAFDLPVYGIKGVGDPLNNPGAIAYGADTWVDTSGNFWLFGGVGISYYGIAQNNLWKYEISSDQWTWMGGDSIVGASAVHGVLGVPALANNPGARQEGCSAWTDSLNNLWLFGGYGCDEVANIGCVNDLWKYDISTNEWTWMNGSAFINAPVNYGTKGLADSSNDPGARGSYVKWKDRQGNFWIMGGWYNSNCLNDVWKYNVSINQWVWMSGTNITNDAGNYQSGCTFDPVNIPYSRYEQRSSVVDNCGRFWFFGGYNYDIGYLSDLWVFDSQQLKWNWVSGTNAGNVTGNYGTQGVPSPFNIPPARRGAVAWWSNDNRFYMFGGLQNDFYSDVWMFNPDTSCVPVCDAAAVLSPVANFQSNKVSACANDCINFTDLSSNATSWQWLFAGAIDSTSAAQNPQNICYSNAGIYNVRLIASNAGGSDTLTLANYITINPAPPTPVITKSNDTLFCSTDSSYKSYQWYEDTVIIPSATNSYIVISQSGNYNVKVTNGDSCSIAVGTNVVGITEFTVNGLQFMISPNPVTEELLIRGNGREETGVITVYNILGETIYTNKLHSKQETINCKPFPAGIYFVQVLSENGRWIEKFIKE